MRVKQPLPALVRRCRVNASLVFVLLATMTIALWQMSIVFLDLRLEEVLSSGGQQSIQRLSSFLSDRLFALRLWLAQSVGFAPLTRPARRPVSPPFQTGC